MWRRITRAGTFPGACTYSMFKTSEATGIAIHHKVFLLLASPLSYFRSYVHVGSAHVCRQKAEVDTGWRLPLSLLFRGKVSNLPKLAYQASLAMQRMFRGCPAPVFHILDL